MELYSIGDACRLLGVKAHVLRYWEQELPVLSPGKDQSGKRIYRESDLHILFRIRYLIQEERLTLEGVRLRLWKELEAGEPDLQNRIRQIRGDALRIYRIIDKQKKQRPGFRFSGGSADNDDDGQRQ